MAPAMLVLVRAPWPAARGLLWNRWERLRLKLRQSWRGFPRSPWGPALAIQGPAVFTEPTDDTNGSKEISSLWDSIFWMAAPKNRRSIEVNRCRRRNPQKLIKIKNNIDMCPECGHLKLKHVLCGYCYEKVCKETAEIRRQIGKQEGGPFKAPPVETVVLYAGEAASEQDRDLTDCEIMARAEVRHSRLGHSGALEESFKKEIHTFKAMEMNEIIQKYVREGQKNSTRRRKSGRLSSHRFQERKAYEEEGVTHSVKCGWEYEGQGHRIVHFELAQDMVYRRQKRATEKTNSQSF